MTFADDEPIAESETETRAESGIEAIAQGRILAKIPPWHKDDAPLNKCTFKVLLEVAGAGTNKLGLDLVIVLDISGSMGGEKLEKMKKAVQFVIKKLSPVDDRLSIVTFNGGSERKCALRRITEQSQKEIEDLVNRLAAGGSTNIAAGLKTGLQVLNDRRQKGERAEAIMLMSDGQANSGCDGTDVPIGKVSVFTFGFGKDHDSKALSTIARNSTTGTFADVGKLDDMTIAFSQCLAGLLSVAVKDLELIITKLDSDEIKILSPLGYPQSEDKTKGSITISFGDLYIKEVRKILVEVQLSDAVEGENTDVLTYAYPYSINGTKSKSQPRRVNIPRIEKSEETPECVEVMIEEKRIQAANMMTEAIALADEGKLEDARKKLNEAINLLGDEAEHQPIETLISELQLLMGKMKTIEEYKKEGRPFALSSESSHNRQRFASKADAEKLRSFTTPLMDIFLEQAMSFDKDPEMPLPKGAEDLKQELAENPQKTQAEEDKNEYKKPKEPAAPNPFASVTEALKFCIQYALQFLQAIGNIVKRGR